MMTETPDSGTREAFEKWFSGTVYSYESFDRDTDGDYENPDIRLVFRAWKAGGEFMSEQMRGNQAAIPAKNR